MNIKNGDVMVAELDEAAEKIKFTLKEEEKKKEYLMRKFILSEIP